MWRWALVGTTTAVVDYFLFILFYSVIKSVFVSNFCAGLISLTFNYLAHYFWSFQSAVDHSKSGVKYLVNLLLFWLSGTVLLNALITSGIDPKIAKIIPVPLIAPLSFLSLRFFVFRGNKNFLSKNQRVS
jgi:putative flippase GtrA